MFGLLDFIAILLIIFGWCVITQAARDIIVTARLAASVRQKKYRIVCLLLFAKRSDYQ